VLELSSFQLWHLDVTTPMPHIAVVIGCSPNHLDWHGSWEHYVAAKQRILTGQSPDSLAVLNMHDPQVASWVHLVRGRLLPLVALEEIPPLPVPGEHNRINAALAAAAAFGAGCTPEAVTQGLESFRPLSQRLEWLAVVNGRRFYNDSSATTPESTVAALESVDPPVWLMAGGREKGCDFTQFITTVPHYAQGAAFFGTVGQSLCDQIKEQAAEFPCTAVKTMADALAWCWDRSLPGDAIILSPACTSGDQFRNYHQRGRQFVDLLSTMAGRVYD
jgi:UDP-N-acetylmuramoylalanine--D-glutamate ligase